MCVSATSQSFHIVLVHYNYINIHVVVFVIDVKKKDPNIKFLVDDFFD